MLGLIEVQVSKQFYYTQVEKTIKASLSWDYLQQQTTLQVMTWTMSRPFAVSRTAMISIEVYCLCLHKRLIQAISIFN